VAQLSSFPQKRPRHNLLHDPYPGGAGFEFVENKRNEKRPLIVREGQHEYIFMEAS